MKMRGRESAKSKPGGFSGRVPLLVGIALGLGCWPACGGGGATTTIPTLAEIQISPANSQIPLGATSQMKATGVYTDGSKQNLTPFVTWSVSSSSGSTNFVSIDSTGLAKGMAPGTSIINASLRTAVGVTQLSVNTNGLSTSTIAILTVPFQGASVDAAYFPQSHTPNAQGVYTVQELNLSADQFSSALPIPSALIASVPMPPGYVPNAAAASPANKEVAVISYSSPNVQVIDANNDIVNDLTSNTVIATFTAPVTKTAAFNGINCMICGIVINPTTGQALLSTAQGYFTMDLNSGAFTSLPLAPIAFPAANFTLNPLNPDAQLVFSPTYGQDPDFPGEVQLLNLSNNTVVTNTGLGTVLPGAVAIDFFTNAAVVSDRGGANQALLNLNELQNPSPTTWAASETLVPVTGGCGTPPAQLSMAAMIEGVGSQQQRRVLFSSQPSGNCVGFETPPSGLVPGPPDPVATFYGFGTMPPLPDGSGFANGGDPNAISAYVSISNKKMYGLLTNVNQDWIARVDLASVANGLLIGLPDGQDVSGALLAGQGGNPIVYLPTAGPLEVCTIPTLTPILPPGTCN